MKSHNQKGFTKKFLKLMNQLEDICCDVNTITPTGTTGNQTINKASGTVNIAAAGTSVTVTNNKVTANSIVIPVIRTVDATAKSASVVSSDGSFLITLNAAATAEVSIGFVVIH